jgi:hypothetical protein
VHIDLWIALGGLVVGLVVGLTGMGGGALMTPMLILLFGVQPLAAVSSDLVAAVVMKPVGGAVHLSRRTVHLEVVRWLALGSVPSAFVGVLLLRWIGGGDLQHDLRLAMGAALVLALVGMVVRALLGMRHAPVVVDDIVPPARPLPTVLVGVLGGVMVGMTSVGSGSLMIVLLMLLYPRLSLRRLVGTDLVQAIPLVGSAALGQLIFGHVQFGLTTSLLIGSLPGVYVGARLSAAATGSYIRWVLGIVIASSAAKLLGADNVALAVVIVGGAVIWLVSTVVVPFARRAVPSGA